MKKIIFCIFLLFLMACSSKEQKKPEPNVEKFFQVYQTFLELGQADSLDIYDRGALLDSALALHGMDSTTFDSTLSYFEKRPDIFLEAFEKFDLEMRSQRTGEK